MSRENITFYPSETASLKATQLEPLVMSAYGLPAKTIAYNLGKAEPTIVHHLVDARRHYNARNNIHAVAVAIALGDIKFKYESSYASTLRCCAFLFAALAGMIAIQETPFVFEDIDNAIARTTKHVRSHRGSIRSGRRDSTIDTTDPLDTLIV